MALRTFNVSFRPTNFILAPDHPFVVQKLDENSTRVGGGKNYYEKPDVKPRAALGTLSNLVHQRESLHKDLKVEGFNTVPSINLQSTV